MLKHPNLPALPLVEGCLFVDNSSWIEGMCSCYRQLQYRSLNKRILAAERPALNFGSAIHLGLEHRYKTYQNKSVDEAYYNDLVGLLGPFFEQHETPTEDWRTLNWCMRLLRKYNEKYDIEGFNLLVGPDGKPLVELPFALPLYTHTHGATSIPVVYSGKIDLPISIDGEVFIMDHKTTSMMGSMFWDQLRRSSQQKGYVWAFENLTGTRVTGYQVNGIRSKEPPMYVQAGKTTGKLSPESWWNESFQRERFIIKPGELEEWKNNTIDLVEEFFFHYNKGYMPMKTTWCSHYGKCQFYDVCQLDAPDRAFMLASGQYTDNNWNPLKEPSQSKQ